MDIISAYREVGSYRGAAAISGTTPKTVKRVIARHKAGGVVAVRAPRISAKRLLPAARPAGYGGSARNFRRLVAARKALWRKDNHRRWWWHFGLFWRIPSPTTCGSAGDRVRNVPTLVKIGTPLTRIRLRHEALLSRMEVRDRPSPRRRSGGVKLEAA